MSFRVLLTATVGIAAGYVAARQLMADSAPQQLEQLPEGARGPLLAARRRLIAGRARAGEAIREGRLERDAAAAELLVQYHRMAGRE
jgi:hypothetical protein